MDELNALDDEILDKLGVTSESRYDSRLIRGLFREVKYPKKYPRLDFGYISSAFSPFPWIFLADPVPLLSESDMPRCIRIGYNL